jgi:hypothetical protein
VVAVYIKTALTSIWFLLLITTEAFCIPKRYTRACNGSRACAPQNDKLFISCFEWGNRQKLSYVRYVLRGSEESRNLWCVIVEVFKDAVSATLPCDGVNVLYAGFTLWYTRISPDTLMGAVVN